MLLQIRARLGESHMMIYLPNKKKLDRFLSYILKKLEKSESEFGSD